MNLTFSHRLFKLKLWAGICLLYLNFLSGAVEMVIVEGLEMAVSVVPKMILQMMTRAVMIRLLFFFLPNISHSAQS